MIARRMQARTEINLVTREKKCNFRSGQGFNADLFKIMKDTWIIPAAALVVGALGGVLVAINFISPSSGSGDKNPSSENRHEKEAPAARPAPSPLNEGGGKRGARISTSMDILKIAGNSDRVRALLDFYAGLTPDQLKAEASKLEGMPMSERIMSSFLLFGRWGEKDPMEAMKFTNTLGFAGAFVRPTILQSWASADPANAAQYYASHSREFGMGMMGGRGPGGGQGGASVISSEWARQDPAGAMAWASSLTGEKNQAMSSVVGEVAKTDPKKAAEMVAAMDSTDKSDSYRAVASQYGATNFAEAQAWIRSLPAADQAAAMASAISGLSKSDPQAASAQVTGMEAGDSKDRAISSVVTDWARVNPQAAAEFLKQQDSAQAQRDAMRNLMPNWVSQDASAALAYANSYAAGEVRDSALGSYVMSNSTAAPADLVKVAETITDERDRGRTVGMAASRWMAEDPTAAKAYIETSTAIPDDAKPSILSGQSGFGRRGRGGP